jgi:3-ketosteroid 9alpha-monooxygenase subunit B
MTGATYGLTVRRVIVEASDARSFELSVPPALVETFRYRSGQFLGFDVMIGGEVIRRCYSLSSAPEIDEFPSVTVKRVSGGRVSNWFNDRVKVGDRLLVVPPSGRFVLGTTPGPLCLYAGGSGITPIISLLKTALHNWTTPIRLYYANRDSDAVIFSSALERLAAEHPTRLLIQHHLDLRDGLASEAELSAFMRNPIGWRHYICGPGPFMALVETTLSKARVPVADTHVERFTVMEVSKPKELLDVVVFEPEMTVTLEGRTRAIRCLPGETVLEAARRSGLQPPASCEAGICASCLAKVTRGRTIMRHNEVLNVEEIAEGLTLTCQAVPASAELHIEY